MAARRPFWKWHRWKSIGFCLWPPSTCIWNLKLKFQSKLDLCSGNHAVYRQTDGQTDRRTRWIQYTPPPTSLGGGIITRLCVRISEMLVENHCLKPYRESLNRILVGLELLHLFLGAQCDTSPHVSHIVLALILREQKHISPWRLILMVHEFLFKVMKFICKIWKHIAHP